jgi:two-component system CheB/CheR fusion protein
MEMEALGSEAFGGRVTIGGPEVPLRKSAVEMLALAIHELLTNAIKHGALASPDGHVSVTWRIEGTQPGRSLVVEWVENGIVRKPRSGGPESTGYGRTLIEQALPYSFSADTTFELDADAMRCVIRVPFAKIGAGEAG